MDIKFTVYFSGLTFYNVKMSFANRKPVYRNYELGPDGELDLPRSTAYYQDRKRARKNEDLERPAVSRNSRIVQGEPQKLATSELGNDPNGLAANGKLSLMGFAVNVELSEDEDDDDTAGEQAVLTVDEEIALLIELEKWRKFRNTKEQLNINLQTTHLAKKEIATLQGRDTCFPRSIYLLRKMYESEISYKQPIYYFCPEHGCLLEPVMMGEKCNIEFLCDINSELGPHTLHLDQLHQSSMIVVSLEEQLQQLLEMRADEVERSVEKRNKSTYGDIIPDLYSGKYYNRLIKKIGSMDLTLIVHIDGARLTGSSDLSAYVVHWTLVELDASSRCHQGILHTLSITHKERTPHRKVLLKPFLDEMKKLSTTGMTRMINGKETNFRVFVTCCIADAMERVPLVGVSSIHCPFGCPVCLAPTTTWMDPDNARIHKQVYLYDAAACADKRTDKATSELGQRIMSLPPEARDLARKNPSYKGIWESSPLLPLKTFDIILSLPTDFMHMFLKGLLPHFVDHFHFVQAAAAEIDKRQSALDVHNAISRKFRTWLQRNMFKANEWMNILFVGLYLLYELVSFEEFSLWALLISIGTTATQDHITLDDIAALDEETHELVRRVERYFGHSFMLFNVHQLLHVADACRQFGSMANYCALAGEDWIGKLVKSLKSFNQMTRELANTLVLNKIANRLAGRIFTESIVKNEHTDLLDKISRSSFHSSSKKVPDALLLGKKKSFAKVRSTAEEALVALLSYVREIYGVNETVDVESVVHIYDKVIVEGYTISSLKSKADEDANSLLYSDENLLKLLYAVDFSELGVYDIPTLLICKAGEKFAEKPYGLTWHLPTFSLFSWTDKFVILPVNGFRGIFIETPYNDNIRMACRLPRILFRMD